MELFNETVIEHLGGESFAGVSSGERGMKNRLAKLAEQYPEDVKLIATNTDGSVFYHVPYKWVSIRRPKQVNWTEEQKAAAAERLRLARDKHQKFDDLETDVAGEDDLLVDDDDEVF